MPFWLFAIVGVVFGFTLLTLVAYLDGCFARRNLVLQSNCRFLKSRELVFMFYLDKVTKATLEQALGRHQDDKGVATIAKEVLYPDSDWAWINSMPEDKHTPLEAELKEALIHLRGLQGVRGEAAQAQREELARHINQMRSAPACLEQQAVNARIASLTPDVRDLGRRIKEKMELLEQASREVFSELDAEDQEHDAVISGPSSELPQASAVYMEDC